jgi:hypothetical protein
MYSALAAHPAAFEDYHSVARADQFTSQRDPCSAGADDAEITVDSIRYVALIGVLEHAAALHASCRNKRNFRAGRVAHAYAVQLMAGFFFERWSSSGSEEPR